MSTLPRSSELETYEQAIPVMLSEMDLDEHSVSTYGCGLRVFLRWISESKLSPRIKETDADILGNFNQWLKDNYADRTRRLYLTTATHLMRWLDVKDLLPDIAFFDRMYRRIDGARGRRQQHYQQRAIDPHVMQVLDYWKNRPLPNKGQRRLVILRNRVLMAFLYDTAARISETLVLTRADVLDGNSTYVRLSETKNDRPRVVFLSEETQQLVRDYVKERDDTSRAPLFVSHGRSKGTPITTRHAWMIVKEAAIALGLLDTTSPHALRHRRAQDLFDKGMPLEWLQALLGHVSPETTRIVYAPDTDTERLSEMVKEYGMTPSDAAHNDPKRKVRGRWQ